jgi:alpha-1,3-glucosyltransferase
MIQIQNLNFESQMTIFFQRSSVLVSECVLYIATVRYLKSSSMSVTYASSSRRGYDAIVVFLLVVFNAGLIIVDNIHFQVS